MKNTLLPLCLTLSFSPLATAQSFVAVVDIINASSEPITVSDGVIVKQVGDYFIVGDGAASYEPGEIIKGIAFRARQNSDAAQIYVYRGKIPTVVDRQWDPEKQLLLQKEIRGRHTLYYRQPGNIQLVEGEHNAEYFAAPVASATPSGGHPDSTISPSKLKHTYAESVDTIVASVINGPSTTGVNVKLKVPGNITWWKSIKIYEDGKEIASIETYDDLKEASKVITPNATSRYSIEFLKAKTFGVHTPIKTHSIDLFAFRGKTLEFLWSKDW
ncbi:hypothetical protein H6G45_18455 [Synechocystis sp. FACHB-383]|uniref:hypothetical protein n=1 Tax=Synechocystis sp. FACHB-383 TaxID=2692864 RepID=UPI001683801C|nr:hypothetical protein [Synechocystis sp. FACHB-383]MBD2655423.1 hypothetical protein [Synechocystis sp. FACHB-383]